MRIHHATFARDVPLDRPRIVAAALDRSRLMDLEVDASPGAGEQVMEMGVDLLQRRCAGIDLYIDVVVAVLPGVTAGATAEQHDAPRANQREDSRRDGGQDVVVSI